MTKQQDFYTLLGLSRNATADEIRQAYFEAARRLHPDRNIAPGETELFLGAQEAYEVLSNPKRREKYDASLPPEELPSSPLDSRVIYSRQSLLRMEEPQLIYVIVELSTPVGIEAIQSPPLNLCMVLDRSTSMQGSNMDVVKATAIQILRRLKPQDVFSVVAFSDRAEVVVPAARGADPAKQEVRIQMLQPDGGTEILSGLQLGYDEISRNLTRSQVNHIILLTDGRTYGDEEKCLALAQRAADAGVGISGLGIGPEWNDNFLDQLAARTGGSSMYVSRPQDIQHALLDKFTRLGNLYAEETRYEFEVPNGMELRYAFRLQPEAGLLSFGSPILMGPVVQESSLRVLMELVVGPEAVRRANAVLLDGNVFVTLASQSTPSNPIPLRLTCAVSEEAGTEPPPAEILDALSRLKLYRLQEQARLELTAGNYDQAAEHLTRLATHLLARGERGLAKTALVEAENIQHKKSFSQQGGKEIKYGTRALLMSGSRTEAKEK
jgi:Ca-activated chloride channel family protein